MANLKRLGRKASGQRYYQRQDRKGPDALAGSGSGFSDLQPGPAALTDGLARLRAIIDGWHAAKGSAQ